MNSFRAFIRNAASNKAQGARVLQLLSDPEEASLDDRHTVFQLLREYTRLASGALVAYHVLGGKRLTEARLQALVWALGRATTRSYEHRLFTRAVRRLEAARAGTSGAKPVALSELALWFMAAVKAKFTRTPHPRKVPDGIYPDFQKAREWAPELRALDHDLKAVQALVFGDAADVDEELARRIRLGAIRYAPDAPSTSQRSSNAA